MGAALARHLGERFGIVPVVREPGEPVAELATWAAADADVIVNAAGVAHLEAPAAADLERLRAGNVELPLLLAAAALEHRRSFVHISSVKAAHPDESPYAASKHEAEAQLEARFAADFERAGTSLVVVRPLAMLFPPFDAGKLRHLRMIRWIPAALTPPLRLPVITDRTLFGSVDAALDRILAGTATPGLSRHRVPGVGGGHAA